MERESFRDPVTAGILNRYFVSIKVDREERPDIDSVYMNAVAAMTGGGGWPLSVFLLPDGTPFYGGTYFPPEGKAAGYRMPGFPTVLRTVAQAFRERRDELVSSGRRLIESLKVPVTRREDPPGPKFLENAFSRIRESYDPENGGFGSAPKFPQPMILEYLLRRHAGTGNSQALSMLEKTLQGMARGGIRDQLAGGFHRYSTDERWLIPHFEKMLYDNGLLAKVYTRAFQVTGKPCYRVIAEETLDYLLREMRHPGGGFFSTQDADSRLSSGGPREEGAYFVWSPRVIREVLGSDADVFCRVFGVTEEGNYKGRNVLHMARLPEEAAEEAGVSGESVSALVLRGKKRLLAVRESRPRPFRDEKIITAWNGIVLGALSNAACALRRPDYLQAAELAAGFLLDCLRRDDGRLLRSWKDGEGRVPGFLEDHALLADGLLSLYHADGDQRWLNEASALGDSMLDLFRDNASGEFHETGTDHERLIVRPVQASDGGTPSAMSAAAGVFMKLSNLTGKDSYHNAFNVILAGRLDEIGRMPLGFGGMLCRIEDWVSPQMQIVITGSPDTRGHRGLLEEVHRRYLPNAVLVRSGDGFATDHPARDLLAHRGLVEGRAAAFVCRGGECRQPVTEPSELGALLEP